MSTYQDNSWIIWVSILPLMVMMMFIITSNNDSDEYALLTDEQKLEKQKELELEKETKVLQERENNEKLQRQINDFINEKPLPYSAYIGIIVVLITIASLVSRNHNWGGGMFVYLNPRVAFPGALLILYILWLLGYLDR